MRPQLGKQKIFDAAMKLFESQGYFSTTVDQITADAGVSKGLVYNYFSSKEALLVGLIEDATSKMVSVADALVAPNGSIEESLSNFLDCYFVFLSNERQFLKLQLTLMLMPELKEVMAKPQQHRAELLLKIVARLFKKAKVANPKQKARLFLAMLDGVALHYLCVFERYPLNSMKLQLVQATKDMCKEPKTGNNQ